MTWRRKSSSTAEEEVPRPRHYGMYTIGYKFFSHERREMTKEILYETIEAESKQDAINKLKRWFSSAEVSSIELEREFLR